MTNTGFEVVSAPIADTNDTSNSITEGRHLAIQLV